MCSCQNAQIGRKRKNKMAKKSKTRRRRSSIRGLNQKDIGSLAMQAGTGAVGAVVLNMVLEKILPADYVQYKNYITLAGGIGLAAMSKNTYLATAGMGAAVVAGAGVVGDLVDGQATGLGLLPPGQRAYAIAGNAGAGTEVQMM